MRPVLKYKKVSRSRLKTLPTTLPFLEKRRKAIERVEHEREVRAEIARQTAKHGRSVENKYRMKKGEYAAIMVRQNHSCLTCNRHETDFPRRLHVDHCHKTRKVRGILCGPCNYILGLSRESPQTLRHLAAYLEFHASKE